MRRYDILNPAQGGQTTCPMQSRELHIESRPFFVRYWIVNTTLFVIIAVGLLLPNIRLTTQIWEGMEIARLDEIRVAVTEKSVNTSSMPTAPLSHPLAPRNLHCLYVLSTWAGP